MDINEIRPKITERDDEVEAVLDLFGIGRGRTHEAALVRGHEHDGERRRIDEPG